MGRKKSNARPVERGRKIHVNKYINQRGKTKPYRRSAASCKLISKELQFHELPADQWPVTKIPKQYEIWFAELGNHYGTSVQSGNSSGAGHQQRYGKPQFPDHHGDPDEFQAEEARSAGTIPVTGRLRNAPG